MNTNTTLCKGSWIQVNKRWAARAGILLLLLLLALPCAAQAQFTYTVSGGKITITGYTGPGGALTIPSAIASLPVTSLANMAFYNCTSLTSVTIPDSVTNLQGDTFLECTHLTEIVVDTLNPVYTSVAGVVFDKSQTTLVMCPAGRAGGYTIPNSVTSIEGEAFKACGLTSVVIPDTVTSIGVYVFANCSSLTNATISNSFTSIGTGMFYGCSNLPCVTIPNRVTTIGSQAFAKCTSLISVTIPSSVTDIQDTAFWNCSSLTSVYFQGNAPSLTLDAFLGANNATVYYLPGTTGWATTFGGRPTVLWDPPVIRTSPQTQTAEAGSAADLRVQASGSSPLFCVWYLNYTNLLSCSTNRGLALTSVQFSQSGAYTVVVSNALGAVTSAPAMLNVIAAVEHRPVPGVKVTGETGSLLTVDSADSLSPAPNWTTLGSVSLTSTPQYYFDLTLPLPPQRFYRAWQTGTPGVMPSLVLHMVPAITLTGSIGGSVRLDYINQFGPIDAWVTLNTVTLTNTSQLYFDVSAPMQPARLYRLVPLP